MAYKVYSLFCRNHDHGEMDYKGEGNFECSVCGFTYHDDEYDDNSDERMSVYDAALIWRSKGKDEDYMFGYTEEELEAALQGGVAMLVLGINHILKWCQIVSGGRRYTCPTKTINGELFLHFKKEWHRVLDFTTKHTHEFK